MTAIFIVLYTTFGGMVSVAHIGVVTGVTMIAGMSIPQSARSFSMRDR